jgi:secreted Zn-dependent insulinase-like peptidase
MFDEASDIQMHGKLNVFVNVCLYTGEVKTLTLALQGNKSIEPFKDIIFSAMGVVHSKRRSVQHITSISYNTNTGKILCIAPDLFDQWSLLFLMSL